MATIIETVERDGETINIYESGAEYSVTRGRLVKAPPSAMITPEKSNVFKRLRQEKTAALLRKRITEATNKVSTIQHRGSASAIADTGGILWEEIVLNPEAYHRDRLEAFEKLGKYAQALPGDMKQQDDQAPGATAAAAFGTELARSIMQIVRDVIGAKQSAEIIDIKPD